MQGELVPPVNRAPVGKYGLRRGHRDFRILRRFALPGLKGKSPGIPRVNMRGIRMTGYGHIKAHSPMEKEISSIFPMILSGNLTFFVLRFILIKE